LSTHTKAKVTVGELRDIFATKLGFRREQFDFYRTPQGAWDASLLAHPGWTPAFNAQVKQLARALQPHFELMAKTPSERAAPHQKCDSGQGRAPK
jgi:hypothetical protein